MDKLKGYKIVKVCTMNEVCLGLKGHDCSKSKRNIAAISFAPKIKQVSPREKNINIS